MFSTFLNSRNIVEGEGVGAKCPLPLNEMFSPLSKTGQPNSEHTFLLKKARLLQNVALKSEKNGIFILEIRCATSSFYCLLHHEEASWRNVDVIK